MRQRRYHQNTLDSQQHQKNRIPSGRSTAGLPFKIRFFLSQLSREVRAASALPLDSECIRVPLLFFILLAGGKFEDHLVFPQEAVFIPGHFLEVIRIILYTLYLFLQEGVFLLEFHILQPQPVYG